MQPVSTGVKIEFVYNGKKRVGKIEKMGTSDNGDWFTVELENGDFRCFTIAKCDGLKVTQWAKMLPTK